MSVGRCCRVNPLFTLANFASRRGDRPVESTCELSEMLSGDAGEIRIRAERQKIRIDEVG